MKVMSLEKALAKLKEACAREGYDYRGTMGDDLGLNEIVPVLEDVIAKKTPTVIKSLGHQFVSADCEYVACPHCHQHTRLSYRQQAYRISPRFCSHCGHAITVKVVK